jgi:hypothetical protein
MTILTVRGGVFLGGRGYTEWKCILSERKRNCFKLHTRKQRSNFNDLMSVGERFLISDRKFEVPFVLPESMLFYYIF